MKDNNEFYEEYEMQRETLSDRFLTNEDYEKLYLTAKFSGEETLKYIMRVLKETGIRYGSLKDLTVEAVNAGKIDCEVRRKF